MARFKLPIDIMNRAAQWMRKPRFNSPTSNTLVATELNFAYDKIRQYELQRNLWVFGTREAIVRPVRNDTLLIQPAAWSATVIYPVGSIVAYPAGTYWIANIIVQANQAAPGNATVDANGHLIWESYFGPLTAERFHYSNTSSTSGGWQSPIYPNANSNGDNDRTSGYNAGELVYLPKGDGTAVVYQALADTDEPPWYAPPWDSDHTYKAGDIAGFPNPNTQFELDETDTLNGPDVLGSTAYMSTANLNIGNDPTLTQTLAAPPTWDIVTTWQFSAYVVGSDNQVYLCVQNSTGDANTQPGALGYNPVTDYGYVYWQPQHMYVGMWTATIPAGVAINSKWQIINATLIPIVIAWPLGAGPAEDTFTVNVFRVPSNWLRLAPDNPKTGLIPWLGGPTFIPQRDWVFYGPWMVSSEVKPIRLRFIADFQDVSQMDTMFCEALAITLALECAGACDATEAVADIDGKYRMIVSDARQVNAIEVGPVIPPDDSYISVRN